WRGDWALVLPETSAPLSAFEAAAAALPRRGPDFLGAEAASVSCGSGCDAELHLRSSVLHIRGQSVVRQPVAVVSPKGSDASSAGRLLFNGEIYAVSPALADGSAEPALALEENDTLWLAEQVAACEAEAPGDSWEPLALALRNLLERLHGPFALSLWSPRR
ncbi:unnamed protein product, partial [Polarella glacialis]